MKQNNINVSQLSKNTGLTNTTISRICSDPASNPTISSLERIADFFNVTPNQLLGRDPLPNNINNCSPNFSAWENIPIITLKQAIKWPNNIEEVRENESTNYILTDIDIAEDYFAIIAEDETLEPKFSQGTILIFAPNKEVKNKNYVIMHDENKSLPQIRQILIDGSDMYTKTINPEFSPNGPVKINHENIKVLGVLVQAKANYL